MNTIQIEEFLQIEFKKKKSTFKIFPPEVIDFIINYARDNEWEGNLKLNYIFQLMKKGFKRLPTCSLDNCNKQVRVGEGKPYLTNGCCIQHSSIIKNRIKYGCDYTGQSETVRNKAKQTCLEKYGFEYAMQNPQTIQKRKNTNMEKYGVEDICNISNDIKFKRKEYIWKTGEISLVQGYEPIVLKELEEDGYKFKDILTDAKDMPKIMYQLDEKEHRYYPDIFIPKDNIIIEVKSDYTLKVDWEINQLKFEATKSHGFDFRLEVR